MSLLQQESKPKLQEWSKYTDEYLQKQERAWSTKERAWSSACVCASVCVRVQQMTGFSRQRRYWAACRSPRRSRTTWHRNFLELCWRCLRLSARPELCWLGHWALSVPWRYRMLRSCCCIITYSWGQWWVEIKGWNKSFLGSFTRLGK